MSLDERVRHDARAGRSHAVPSSRSYRADLDGLRALSILLVIAFHAGVARLSGGFIGVDVFFVISGFLITGILLEEAVTSGSISLRNFYSRRIRRLLPLSAVVLVVTVLAGMALVPALDRATLLGDARSAALYVSNWRFAGQSTAYADTGPGESLFVHYWSLSIEEQFYLLWPVIILIATRVVMRRKPEALRRSLEWILIALVVTSFALSVVLTHVQGQSAYYATHLRLGELAVGAFLAVGIAGVRRLRGRTADVLGIAGLACIVAAAVLFGRRTPFPGSAVLLPVAGAALVIASGSARPAVAGRWLGRPPLPAVGRISYAWYLWHWPALGVAALMLGSDASSAARTAGRVVAVVASLGLAIVSHHVIENPIRFSERLKRPARRGLALGAALTAVAVAATLLPTSAATRPVRSEAGRAMTPAEARDAIVRGMGPCRISFLTTTAAPGCVFGDPNGEKTVALVGDSVAQQWFPTITRAARANGWKVLAWTKDACPIVDVLNFVSRLNRPYRECVSWRANVLERLRAHPGGVDLVVLGRATYAAVNVLDADGSPIARGTLGSVWRRAAARTFSSFQAVADRVIILRDTPVAPRDIPSCLSEFPNDPERCEFARSEGTDKDRVITQAERAAAPRGVDVVDLTEQVCPSDPCPVVTRDGVIVYRDRHHITTNFAETLTPYFERLIRRFLAA